MTGVICSAAGAAATGGGAAATAAAGSEDGRSCGVAVRLRNRRSYGDGTGRVSSAPSFRMSAGASGVHCGPLIRLRAGVIRLQAVGTSTSSLISVTPAESPASAAAPRNPGLHSRADQALDELMDERRHRSGTSRSRAAASPRSKSLRSSVAVNVGWKSSSPGRASCTGRTSSHYAVVKTFSSACRLTPYCWRGS